MQTKDLLDHSQDILRYEEDLDQQYEGYYEQLAEQQALSPEEQAVLRDDVTREVERLKQAASHHHRPPPTTTGRTAPGSGALLSPPPRRAGLLLRFTLAWLTSCSATLYY